MHPRNLGTSLTTSLFVIPSIMSTKVLLCRLPKYPSIFPLLSTSVTTVFCHQTFWLLAELARWSQFPCPSLPFICPTPVSCPHCRLVKLDHASPLFLGKDEVLRLAPFLCILPPPTAQSPLTPVSLLFLLWRHTFFHLPDRSLISPVCLFEKFNFFYFCFAIFYTDLSNVLFQ